MIAVVNYGSGNIQAILNIYKRLNIAATIAECAQDLAEATRIILPGVGSFDYAMEQLECSGMREILDKRVIADAIPVLGICVGMQILANRSDEGEKPGLGWIPGEVKLIDESKIQLKPKLPHMGWNDIICESSHPLFQDIDARQGFYFLHSYYFSCNDQAHEIANAVYGDKFTCAVNKGNVYGVQFHPEKSHSNGITLFKNFAGI